MSQEDESRIKQVELILENIEKITTGIVMEEIQVLKEYLNSCSLVSPRSEGQQIIVAKTETCFINLLTEEELEKFPLFKDYLGTNSAVFAFEYNTIIVSPQYFELDYVSLVLLHEAVHGMVGQVCSGLEDYTCRAESEAYAYFAEFAVFDHMATQKNSKYYETLRKSTELLTKSPTIIYPDYEKAGMVREFVTSNSMEQDKAWMSIFWLRTYWEVYYSQYPGDKAVEMYIDFLERLLRDGSI